VVVLMVSGSLNLSDIVNAQGRGTFASMGLNFLSWNWLPLAPMLVVYFVSGVAETNRAPFDVVEGESEIVAGHMIEYSGMTLRAVLSRRVHEHDPDQRADGGDVLRRLAGALGQRGDELGAAFHLVVCENFLVVSMFLWFRATFPRYRYDQIMRLGWKIFIPLTLVWIAVVGLWMQTPWSLWR